MSRDIIIGVSNLIAKKGAVDMLKEIYDLAEMYNINANIVSEIYLKGAYAYEKNLREYLEKQKQEIQ